MILVSRLIIWLLMVFAFWGGQALSKKYGKPVALLVSLATSTVLALAFNHFLFSFWYDSLTLFIPAVVGVFSFRFYSFPAKLERVK
jgi:hypothetical protein